jgi:predicted CopG family antitoxin
MTEIESERKHKSISVTKETYDKLVEMGNMKTSFNDLVTDLMNKANANRSSAASALDTDKETEK